MEKSIYLDTHVIIWLYANKIEVFSDLVIESIKTSNLLFSSMANLELQYLYEIERLKVNPKQILKDLEGELGLKRHDSTLSELTEAASKHSWTRDPFDRLIVSQADLLGLELVSKDDIIRKNFSKAIW